MAQEHARAVAPSEAMRRIVFFSAAIAAFFAIVLLAPPALRGQLRFVAAFDTAATVLIALYFGLAFHRDPDLTRRKAAAEDPGRTIGFGIVLISGFAGLAAAVSVLGHDLSSAHGSGKIVEALAGIAAVVTGWTLIHTTYALRYAHLYYQTGDGRDAGGLTFPGSSPPSDYDFAYYSFVIGMTFQVSDVSITERRLRSETLVHALISFAYNTAIIALGVNVASGLLH